MCHVTDWLHVVEGLGHYKNVEWREIVLEHHNLIDDIGLWEGYVFCSSVFIKTQVSPKSPEFVRFPMVLDKYDKQQSMKM